jgi:hypothetical protein
MKKHLATALIFTWAVLGSGQSALAEEARGPAPVEAFYCKFQPGKGMSDLMPVAQRQKEWSDKNDPNYSAWILTPQFGIAGQLPQVIWLGSAPNGNDFGNGMVAWQTTATDIQKAFNAVVDCSLGHVLASSVEINAPEGIPGDGVVMFSQCSMAEGSDWMKAVDAHKAVSTAMRGMGSKGSSWAFFPMLGGGDLDFDYFAVSTFNSWADYFAAYELYVSGGGWQKFAQTMNGVTSCNDRTPTVWDVKLVRKGNDQR